MSKKSRDLISIYSKGRYQFLKLFHNQNQKIYASTPIVKQNIKIITVKPHSVN